MAKPEKKMRKRLKARIARFESGGKAEAGRTRPGSQNRHKT